ncbi:MAG: ATP-binding cassette domain-containing protein, partial [Eubacteriales bacterium]|nr:ATP-binding cassette domain-containing protein [Eubacteriales bacterium]
MNKDIIKVRNLKKHYKTKDGMLKALDGVDLSIKEGEIVGVIGESGCGKSTLAKLIIGLNTPTEGEILYKDKSVEEWLRKDKLKFRRNLQMIFQNPYDVFDSKMKI